MKKSLHVLSGITIKNPCHESWDDMSGNDQKKFCAHCSHSVVNLSAHTQQDAAEIIYAHRGKRLCIRYTKNVDGTIQFKQSRSPFYRTHKFASWTLATIMAILGLATRTVAEEAPTAPPPAMNHKAEMGKMQVTPAVESPTPTTDQPGSKVTMGEMVAPHDTPEQITDSKGTSEAQQ